MTSGILPEDPVRGVASVSNIVEKHIQFSVVVKVSGDDRANGRGLSKFSCSYVLHKKRQCCQMFAPQMSTFFFNIRVLLVSWSLSLPGILSHCPAGKVCVGRSSCHRQCPSFHRHWSQPVLLLCHADMGPAHLQMMTQWEQFFKSMV